MQQRYVYECNILYSLSCDTTGCMYFIIFYCIYSLYRPAEDAEGPSRAASSNRGDFRTSYPQHRGFSCKGEPPHENPHSCLYEYDIDGPRGSAAVSLTESLQHFIVAAETKVDVADTSDVCSRMGTLAWKSTFWLILTSSFYFPVSAVTTASGWASVFLCVLKTLMGDGIVQHRNTAAGHACAQP